MKDIILVGAGGCMKELLWQFKQYNEDNLAWHIRGYVNPIEDFDVENIGSYKYLGTDEDLLKVTKPTNVVICISDPKTRRRLVEMYRTNPNILFPTVILTEDGVAPDATFGEGCIISKDCIVSSNVHFGNFVFMNLRSTICHDGQVGDYTTLGQCTNIAGTVKIGSNCKIEIGSTLTKGLNIGDSVRICPGSMVVNDLADGITAIGVPAVAKR